MKNIVLIMTLLTMLICQACQDLVHEERIVDKFFLIAVDSKQEMHIAYAVSDDGSYIGVIPATVYSVGYDAKYVYAKQHPEGPNGKTNYYIVPVKISDPYGIDEEVIGPLGENQFYEKLQELGVTESDNLFLMTIKNL